MHAFSAAIVLAFAPAVAAVAEPIPASVREECGTTMTARETELAAALAESGVYSLAQAPGAAADSVVYVPLTFHVVRTTAGTGGLTEARLAQTLIDSNLAFAPLGIVFCRQGPTDFINNSALYDIDNFTEADQVRMINPVPNTINLWFVRSAPFCGLSAFTFSPVQGIVMNNDCTAVPTNHSSMPHEIGHVFDLFHTHETAFGTECVSGSNCAAAGDQVCDTPADPGMDNSNINTLCQYIGATPSPCAGDPPYHPDATNFMSYSRKECRTNFTPGQITRGRATLFNLRPNLVNTIAGDTNGDGRVDFADLNTVLAQFGNSGAPGSLAGDVNADGVVNFADLNLVLANFGHAAC